LPKKAGDGHIFPAPRGGYLSDMSLSAVVKRIGADAVPHGFRSTFRDWAAESTNYLNIVVEMALAHTIGNKVEAAYRRGDLLEKRTKLMNDWAVYCATKPHTGNVTPIMEKQA
jgi:integrase